MNLYTRIRELSNLVAKSDEIIRSHISPGINGLLADDLKVSHGLSIEVVNSRK